MNTSPLTVAQVAEQLGVGEDVIRGHIAAGRLRAANVGLGTERPRWRIQPEAIEQFLALRTATPAPAARRSSRKAAAGVIQFFK